MNVCTKFHKSNHSVLNANSSSVVEHEKAGVEIEQANAVCSPEFVTGKLVGINFQEKILQMQLMNGCSLDISYSDVRNAETLLIENLNNVFHVHGQVTYNEFDEILTVSNVDQILTVDVSPITMDEFVVDNKCYKINPPLDFVVQFDYDEYFYTLEGDLDILLFGYSRIEIEEDLDYSLNLFWADYIQGNPENLAADALNVRQEMLTRFESV